MGKEIRAAFEKLEKQQCPSAEAERKLKLQLRAYQVLTSQSLKRQYDIKRSNMNEHRSAPTSRKLSEGAIPIEHWVTSCVKEKLNRVATTSTPTPKTDERLSQSVGTRS